MFDQSQTREIKSIKTVGEEIKKAKHEFEYLVNCLAIPALGMEEDLQKSTPTIEMILKDIPSQQRLKEMLDHPFAETPEIRQKILSGYKGKYEVIHKAAENISHLKYEAERLYYLAAQLNFYKIKNEFEDQNKPDLKLKNYQISINENHRWPKTEKNTISQQYLLEMRQEQLKVGCGNSSEHVQPGDILVMINLYDSINGQKIFEYLCHGEQTLLEVVSKFYCMISKLQGKEGQHHLNSFCLIEDKFYYYGNMARKKAEEILSFALHAQGEEPASNFTVLLQMGKCKLKSLKVVFGRPYVFRHLDGCDHMIVFKDLVVLKESQVQYPTKKDKYPIVVFQGRMRRRKCDGCRVNFASWVSLNDPLKGKKHLYICEKCHYNLHTETEDQNLYIRYLHD